MGDLSPELSAKLALLDFIETTASFGRNLPIMDVCHCGDYPLVEEQVMAIYRTDLRLINQGIREIGGFSLKIATTEDPSDQNVHLSAWLGSEPNNPDSQKWFGRKDGHIGSFLLSSDAIQDIRLTLLEDFEP